MCTCVCALLYGLYTYYILGPWCVGEIVTGVYGLIWVHGVQAAGHFIPGSLTYLYGVLQVCVCVCVWVGG